MRLAPGVSPARSCTRAQPRLNVDETPSGAVGATLMARCARPMVTSWRKDSFRGK